MSSLYFLRPYKQQKSLWQLGPLTSPSFMAAMDPLFTHSLDLPAMTPVLGPQVYSAPIHCLSGSQHIGPDLWSRSWACVRWVHTQKGRCAYSGVHTAKEKVPGCAAWEIQPFLPHSVSLWVL